MTLLPRRSSKTTWLLLLASLLATSAHAEAVTLFDGKQVASVIHDDNRTLSLAGQLLARDLKALTGAEPKLSKSLTDCGSVCVVIGAYDSPLVTGIAKNAGLDTAALKGQWERYQRVLVPGKRKGDASYLLIAGSDTRGTIWGVIDLTRELGISAWEWWADVTPRRIQRLSVDGGKQLSASPSVQYRGVFLNDEDWGLQPWAAKTYEPNVGDIGPKTYSRIFELMWRLKANVMWPAMHDSTKPFYQIAGNAEIARDYAIVMGTSHAEPMMRNNVREWDDKTRGEFNFFTNREAMIQYWRERAEEVKGFENIYSVGLRGKHDSAMEGAKTPEAARDALTDVFKIERELLSKAQQRPAEQVPQALTLYKEVLDTYMTGLKVPEDITLIWPEDNYGYISQLPNAQERARVGGNGVYYHISYWGRPHDYLWLGATHPALIREQMDRAWETDARKIWIANVGDIKPGEYLTQYFLDLAFDHNTFARTPREHLKQWAGEQFGEPSGAAIADLMTEFYDLAFERRPEFMGFSQTEPTRPNKISDYIRSGGGEAQERLDRYADLAQRAEAIGAKLPADRKDAYFQLVLYPVRGAASMNEKHLKLDLAAVYAKQGRANVNAYAQQAKAAYERIVSDTAAYNSQNNGKWRGMMDLAPRRLPVFDEPIIPQWNLLSKAGCSVDASALQFVSGKAASHSVAVYSAGQPQNWSLSGEGGLKFAAVEGKLNAANGFEQRIRVSYDGGAAIKGGSISCGGKTLKVDARLSNPANDAAAEINQTISLAAASLSNTAWQLVPGLGSRGAALRSKLDVAPKKDSEGTTPLIYRFQTKALTDAQLKVVAIPVHALTSASGVRIGVRVDQGPLQVLDFETHGRSEEWKLNTLSNSASRSLRLDQLAGGAHQIAIYALDPGFILDRIDIKLDGAPDYYGAPPIQ